MPTKKLKKIDQMIFLCFKIIILVFLIGIMIFFFRSLYQGDVADSATSGGVSLASIFGLIKFFSRNNFLEKATNNFDSLSDNVQSDIIKALGNEK